MRIQTILGIEMEKLPATPQPERHCYLENLRRVLPVLRELRVNAVIVSFDGSGDSGSISDVTFDPKLSAESEVEVESTHVEMDAATGRWVQKRSLGRRTLTEAIEALTDDYLNEAGVNWYDNDGGFGELTIGVDEGTVRLEIHTRWMEDSLAYDRARTIVTGAIL
jgi:hypothetical protein